MLTPSIIMPEYKKRIEEMDDEEWYSWDEYTKMATELAKRLGDQGTRNVGMNTVTKAKETYESQGFHTADNVLCDYYQMFAANVRNAPTADPPRTVQYEPGKAVLRAGMAQPAKLIEGHLVGFVRMFGHRLKQMQYEEVVVKGKKMHQFTLAWE